ncbi:MAG: hypothetical protein R3A45_10610 [Bdellovibrionota bacterium]
MSVGEYTFDLKLYLDALSSFVIVLTGLGFFVQLYAWGDQPKTSLWVKYLAYFHLCYGFVLLLLTASSTHLFFVGWQGVCMWFSIDGIWI